jgi:beta-phosphoglucomutase-like phosphatase (HAD superfamily)
MPRHNATKKKNQPESKTAPAAHAPRPDVIKSGARLAGDLAGLMTLLVLADRENIPIVAVTNAPRVNAEMMLSGLGIADRFKAIVIGDEFPHGKPHPMPYLEGLRAVNAASELPLAFETLARALSLLQRQASRPSEYGQALVMGNWWQPERG